MAMLVDSRSETVVRPFRRWREDDQPTTKIGALVAYRAATDGSDIALLDTSGDRAATWRDVAMAAQKWRSRFDEELATGEIAEMRVGLAVSSPLAFGCEYLGALAAGVPLAPLDAGSSEPELLWASASLGLTHVVADGGDVIEVRVSRRRRAAEPRLEGDFPLDGIGVGIGVGVGRAWHPSVAPFDTPFPSPSSDAPERPAVMTATRGTTGAPKLVPFSDVQLLGAAARVVTHFDLQPRDRGLIATPLHLVDSQVVGLLATLLSGGSAVVADFDRRSFWDKAERTEVTWLNVTPGMVVSLSDVPAPVGLVRDRVRFSRVGGGALELQVHSGFWQATGISLVETYTLTEAAGAVAANPLDPARRSPGSGGLPVGLEIRVVDPIDVGSLPVTLGTTGRIQVRGEGLATHYLPYGRKDRRVSVVARDGDGWLDTGDLGYLTTEGYLHVVRRAGDAGVGRPDSDRHRRPRK
jgi:acyl-CoA synthetase (AMP-forming)/AMP-acid ligase II